MPIITFEVTKDKTTVVATGLNGNIDKMDITGTDVEKDLIKLLKKLQEHQLATQIIDTLDINKWERVGG